MALKPIGGEIEAQVLNDNFSYLDERIGLYTETFEVLIPYDYPDLQAAVDHLSRFKASQGVRIVLKIASGHALTKGLLVENGDYGYFRIEAEDADVLLDESFDSEENLIVGRNARMPVLACIINMDGKGNTGYYATDSSLGRVEEGCGIKNAPFSGCSARTSLIHAENTVFTGCFYGYRAQQGGVVFAQGGDASDSISDGLIASRGSTIQFALGKATNCQDRAVRSQRSRIVCIDADLSNATRNAIRCAEASQISANGANCSGAGGNAVEVIGGSSIDINNANISNAGGDAVLVERGSMANAYRADCTNAIGRGISAREASIVNAEQADVSGAGANGLYAERASTINADLATATDTGSIAVMATRGSTISANGVDGSGGDSDYAFYVFRGSIMSCRDSTGQLTQSPNTITADGIIFQ